MQHRRAVFLGRRRLPRAHSAFELEAFFTFTGAERRAIEQRRTPALRLGLALRVLWAAYDTDGAELAPTEVLSLGRVWRDVLAAVGDALGLLANLVMAWNTAQLQSAFDRLNARKSTAVPSELIGRIAPTRTEGINLRGVFRFPVEAYAEKLLPSTPRTAATAAG